MLRSSTRSGSLWFKSQRFQTKYLGVSRPQFVYFFAGGIPYEGWSEGNVVARVTHGYKLPKPDHVDNKLWVLPFKLPCSILNHPIPPTPKKNIFSCLIWFLLSLLNSAKWNKVNVGHQFVQSKIVFSLKNIEKMNFQLLQPDISYHFSHYLARALLRFL